MRTASRLFLSLAAVAFAHAALAQTADEITEKYLTAIGGRAALSKLTSRTMTGTITIATPQGDLSGPVEIYAQAPNKSRTLVKLDLSAFGAGQMTVDQRFDGAAGFVIDTLQGNRDISGGQLESMRNSVFPTPLLNYKDRGATLELTGKEKAGDRDAYVLILKPKAGPPVRTFIDAESYLPLRVVTKLDVPQFGEVEQTAEFSDYREVDGVKIPFAVRASSAVQNSTVVISKVEHNSKLDETMFSKP
jgi:outer membrane lipoprotein-sorting protein